LKAITGVPQAIASIKTNPNGSGQAIGASSPPDASRPNHRQDQAEANRLARAAGHRDALSARLKTAK
jgi:hypothetical protein